MEAREACEVDADVVNTPRFNCFRQQQQQEHITYSRQLSLISIKINQH